MSSVMKVILIGNLGADPLVRFTPDGKGMCSFSVAEKDSYTVGGTRREETHWHKVVFYGKARVEVIQKPVKKGTSIYVEGKLRYRKYIDKDGVERTVAEIVGDAFQLMGSPSRSHQAAANEAAPAVPAEQRTQSSNDEGPDDWWQDYERAMQQDSTVKAR